jgi:hypothetical protein
MKKNNLKPLIKFIVKELNEHFKSPSINPGDGLTGTDSLDDEIIDVEDKISKKARENSPVQPPITESFSAKIKRIIKEEAEKLISIAAYEEEIGKLAKSLDGYTTTKNLKNNTIMIDDGKQGKEFYGRIVPIEPDIFDAEFITNGVREKLVNVSFDTLSEKFKAFKDKKTSEQLKYTDTSKYSEKQAIENKKADEVTEKDKMEEVKSDPKTTFIAKQAKVGEEPKADKIEHKNEANRGMKPATTFKPQTEVKHGETHPNQAKGSPIKRGDKKEFRTDEKEKEVSSDQGNLKNKKVNIKKVK